MIIIHGIVILTNVIELSEQCIEYIDMHEINSLLLSNTSKDIMGNKHTVKKSILVLY